jgi:hypothetical protein
MSLILITSALNQVVVPTQGVITGKKSGNHRGLYPINDINLILVPRQGPEINSRACRLELSRSSQRALCWFPSQRKIFFLRICLETPRACSGPTNPEAGPLLASPSAVSLPLISWHAWRPNKVSKHAEPWYHFTPPDINELMGTLFWWPQDISGPPDSQRKYLRVSLLFHEL